MDIYEQITKMADEIAPELVAQRRDFHKFAEKGWFEMRTSSIIARKLTEMGYEVLVGDQVCKKDARMGVPSDEELEEAALENYAVYGFDSVEAFKEANDMEEYRDNMLLNKVLDFLIENAVIIEAAGEEAMETEATTTEAAKEE